MLSMGSLWGVGYLSVYWSSTASTSPSSAYLFNFNANGVYPSYGDSRVRGFSIRCVADASKVMNNSCHNSQDAPICRGSIQSFRCEHQKAHRNLRRLCCNICYKVLCILQTAQRCLLFCATSIISVMASFLAVLRVFLYHHRKGNPGFYHCLQ